MINAYADAMHSVRLGLAYSKTLASTAAELLARVGQPHQWTGGRREAYEAAKASPDQGQPTMMT